MDKNSQLQPFPYISFFSLHPLEWLTWFSPKLDLLIFVWADKADAVDAFTLQKEYVDTTSSIVTRYMIITNIAMYIICNVMLWSFRDLSSEDESLNLVYIL